MRSGTRTVAALTTLGAAAVLAAGCSSGGETQTVTKTAEVGARSASTLPQGDDPVEIDPAKFSADVTHRYLPLKPGTQWRYEEIDEDGDVLDVVVTVSSETRKIANGVTARVVRDTVTRDGELIEDTLDWYAQDSDGNVWYMGEDTAEFEDGRIASHAGAWEAGVDGALPGIIMPADPADGMAYRQEFYEGEAEDNGEVIAVDEQAQVPAGHYTNVVITKDWITIEPKVLEFKLYAPDVGLVLALGISGGGGREQLTKLTTVSDDVARRAGTAKLGESWG